MKEVLTDYFVAPKPDDPTYHVTFVGEDPAESIAKEEDSKSTGKEPL
jgi:hypothetical protein